MYLDLNIRQGPNCPSGSQWYVCNANGFTGCCLVDACNLSTCPDIISFQLFSHQPKFHFDLGLDSGFEHHHFFLNCYSLFDNSECSHSINNLRCTDQHHDCGCRLAQSYTERPHHRRSHLWDSRLGDIRCHAMDFLSEKKTAE